jgi:predicted  nucleic acid-binding Zn-ribbon protein
MAPGIELVLKLQGLDNRVAELEREIASLPRHVAEIEQALVSHQRKLEADRAALAANQKERRKLEGEIQLIEQKASRLKDQMLEAKTNQQYRAFQHEIEYCEEQIRKAEDRILDLMAESEPLEENVLAAESALKKEVAQVEREKALARKRTEEDRRVLGEFRVERERIAAALDPQTYAVYERTRRKYRGPAVAEGTDGKCSACNIMLRPQFYQDLKKGENLMVCESCGRLLFYNAPIDLGEEVESRQAEKA